MSENDEDKDSKTEDASQKKLDDAVQKGQVVHSKEVTNFLMLLFLSILVIFVTPYIARNFATMLKFFISNSGSIQLDRGVLDIMLSKSLFKSLMYISPIFITVILVAFLSSYMQHGEFVFAVEQIMPQLSRISIIGGFKRLFSMKSVMELLKGFIKITIVAIFLYIIISSDIKYLRFYQNFTIGAILDELQSMINNIMICVAVIMSVVAGADFFYQRFDYFNNLKMTKHEQKEEYKQLEGHPEIKRKIRSLRKEQSQRRIKQTVPKATVVITNPEHYAVALYYDQRVTKAPVVVAKGLDLIAQTIKEIAKEYQVPIVESPPLARMLYKQVKIDQEIPIECYSAVAEIISYVLSSKKET